ncbi:hypothetical protein SAMN04488242_0052 [Tessaracoccus oleiagri]|uniref:Uncharacterized protein n=1 Tax=Tessaracoccus oleiagri TaxID=686624 RepID=A0A1G9H3L9_9ACTN|nr:hypothetical protein SAMN04488242_0052 [Tessaracoccus oleiagri]
MISVCYFFAVFLMNVITKESALSIAQLRTGLADDDAVEVAANGARIWMVPSAVVALFASVLPPSYWLLYEILYAILILSVSALAYCHAKWGLVKFGKLQGAVTWADELLVLLLAAVIWMVARRLWGVSA